MHVRISVLYILILREKGHRLCILLSRRPTLVYEILSDVSSAVDGLIHLLLVLEDEGADDAVVDGDRAVP